MPFPDFLRRIFLCLSLLFLSALPLSAQDNADAPEGPTLPAEIVNPAIDESELTLRLVPLTKDDLAAAAEAWLAIVKAKTEEVMREQIIISQTEGDAQASARERLSELVAERKELFDKYSTVISAWEKKGGDEAAISDFRAYRSSIIV